MPSNNRSTSNTNNSSTSSNSTSRSTSNLSSRSKRSKDTSRKRTMLRISKTMVSMLILGTTLRLISNLEVGSMLMSAFN